MSVLSFSVGRFGVIVSLSLNMFCGTEITSIWLFFLDPTSVQEPKVGCIHAFINIYILVNMDFEHEPSD